MAPYGNRWRTYVPVATRRAEAQRKMNKLSKVGMDIQPIVIEGRTIARTFWGKAWCTHLESFSDYSNRLPRGRTYVRNGSVCHLEIERGAIQAIVSGSQLYNVTVTIEGLPPKKWNTVKRKCSGSIGSLLELLQGKLSESVMEVVTDRGKGLFPRPAEISLDCDCPDWAVMCKHVAAVLYGVGARLDEKPDLLFLLRGVDHEELIGTEVGVAAATRRKGRGGRRLASADISDVFGIEMAAEPETRSRRRKKTTRKKAKKTVSRAKSGSKRKGESATASRAVTGKAVANLRKKLGMSKTQFARLLGLSVGTVGKWERNKGRLNLQARTLSAWKGVERLPQKAAWERLHRQ